MVSSALASLPLVIAHHGAARPAAASGVQHSPQQGPSGAGSAGARPALEKSPFDSHRCCTTARSMSPSSPRSGDAAPSRRCVPMAAASSAARPLQSRRCNLQASKRLYARDSVPARIHEHDRGPARTRAHDSVLCHDGVLCLCSAPSASGARPLPLRGSLAPSASGARTIACSACGCPRGAASGGA
jgi:hypothetical protein